MKKLIFFFSFAAFALPLCGQDQMPDARAATDELTAYYQLDSRQASEMLAIQERRLSNLTSIAELQETNYELYLQKKNSVREGTQASIRRLLTEEQMPKFLEQQLQRRKKESSLIQKMKQEGADKRDIQLAVWELE